MTLNLQSPLNVTTTRFKFGNRVEVYAQRRESEDFMGQSEHSKRDAATSSMEAAVLLFARRHPQFGQAKVASELNLIGQPISPSGVRYIWKKHNLETAYKRLKALEQRPERAARKLNANQLAILQRGDITRRLAQKTGAGASGSETAAPDERQDQILRAAAELFVKHGYGGTSIRDIAHQVGLLPGSIYHYFPSKEDLFVAIHREGFRQLVIRSKNAITTEADPWQRLERDRRNYDQQFRRLVADLDLPGTTDRSLFRLALLGALNWTLIWYRPGKTTPQDIARELIRTFRGSGAAAGGEILIPGR